MTDETTPIEFAEEMIDYLDDQIEDFRGYASSQFFQGMHQTRFLARLYQLTHDPEVTCDCEGDAPHHADLYTSGSWACADCGEIVYEEEDWESI